jgi:hypothetical protein
MAEARFQAGVAITPFATGSVLSWKTNILILQNDRGHFPSPLKRSEREGN